MKIATAVYFVVSYAITLLVSIESKKQVVTRKSDIRVGLGKRGKAIGILYKISGGATKRKALSKKGLFRILKEKVVEVLKKFLPKFFFRDNASKAVKRKKGVASTENGGVASSSSDANSRIQKEMRSFIENPPDNCKLSVGSNIRSWTVSLTGVDGTIFAGEKFKLRMIFPKDYPAKPPSVYFLRPTPKHVHVYSNGDICLNLLGRDWRPTMTAESLVVSILSMLSSAREKKMPPDNAAHADAAPGQQQQGWMYHDDKC